jgi:hypothetical protein
MGLFYDSERPLNEDAFVRWLAANYRDIPNGSARYEGYQVVPETVLVRFGVTVSIGIVTLTNESRFLVVGHNAVVLHQVMLTLLTLTVGWWGIPWGPIFTISTVVGNLSGGRRQTVAELIDELSGSPKQVVELTPEAAAQARLHILDKGFPAHTALYLRYVDREETKLRAEYDDLEPDGRQWRGVSHGVPILIDKDQERDFRGKLVDWQGNQFVCNGRTTAASPNC